MPAVAAQGIFIWGYSPGSLGDGSPQWGPWGNPRRGLHPPEAEAVCKHCLQILTANVIKNLKISHNSPPDSSILDVSQWGLSDISRAKSLKPMRTATECHRDVVNNIMICVKSPIHFTA